MSAAKPTPTSVDLRSIAAKPSVKLTPTALGQTERHESYFELVWRRFRRSKPAIAGGLMVLGLCILAIFAEFFSATPITGVNLKNSFIPPQQVHFIDDQGKFHLVPFVYNFTQTLDPKTFRVTWAEDKSKAYEIQFFIHSWEYKLLGIFPTDLHLFGVGKDSSLYILGTDKLGRDLWGKACEAGRISLSMSLF